MNEETTVLKDINDRIQDLIVESLKTSEILYIRGDYINAYRSIKQVFYKIAPFEFGNKEYLTQITEQIDSYLEMMDNKSTKPDMKEIITIGQQKAQLKTFIEEYFKVIPYSLRELNLYLKIIKRSDDPDVIFSEESFTTQESLLDKKKEELLQLDTIKLIKCLTPKQIHDVYSRLITYTDMGGLKR